MNILEKKKKVIEILKHLKSENVLNSLNIDNVSIQTLYNMADDRNKPVKSTIDKVYNYLEQNNYFNN